MHKGHRSNSATDRDRPVLKGTEVKKKKTYQITHVNFYLLMLPNFIIYGVYPDTHDEFQKS